MSSTRLASLALATLALAACDPPAPPTPARASTSGAEQAVTAPTPQDPESVRRGGTLFEAACAGCHEGDEPRGGRLTDLHRTGAQVVQALHAGSEDGGLMAAVDPTALREEDLPALRAYLRSIGAER
jgi:mono/diheme cytochrome c family protein